MTDHTSRFTGKAGDYARYRERYSPALVLPLLREWCGLAPEWTIADIGAGTGLVADMFCANGNPVIAVEPNAEMRAACVSLHSTDERLIVRDGSAEATGLPDASVEMIAVGRALHWFNLEPALREFRRILKPQGWVTILASGRTEEGREENRAYVDFLYSSAGRAKANESCLGVYRQLARLFPGAFHHTEVDGEMDVDWEGLLGLTLSFSHAPRLDSPGFSEFEAALRRYFDRYARDGRITWTTRTWISAGKFADRAESAGEIPD